MLFPLVILALSLPARLKPAKHLNVNSSRCLISVIFQWGVEINKLLFLLEPCRERKLSYPKPQAKPPEQAGITNKSHGPGDKVGQEDQSPQCSLWFTLSKVRIFFPCCVGHKCQQILWHHWHNRIPLLCSCRMDSWNDLSPRASVITLIAFNANGWWGRSSSPAHMVWGGFC